MASFFSFFIWISYRNASIFGFDITGIIAPTVDIEILWHIPAHFNAAIGVRNDKADFLRFITCHQFVATDERIDS